MREDYRAQYGPYFTCSDPMEQAPSSCCYVYFVFGCAAAVDVFLAVAELVAAAAIGDFFVSVLVAIPGVIVAIVVQVQLIPADKCHSLDSHLNILEWMMRHYSQLIRKT